jgi:nucleoside-diphosphate-sugar epimerase
LLACDARVEAVARSRPARCLAGIQWTEADLTDLGAVRRLVKRTQPELVFHLCTHGRGAPKLDLVIPTFQSDVTTTVNLLTALAECGRPRIVITRSMEEPEGPEAPASPYAAGRAACTLYARLFQTVFHADITFARVFMAYGPGQPPEKLIPYLILSLLRGEAPRLGSGRRLVDWVYIDDVVDGLLALAGSNAVSGTSYDLGSGRLISIRSLAESIAQRIGQWPCLPLHFGAIPERSGEPVRTANVSETRQQLDWRPRVSITEGLERTLDWYRKDSAGNAAPRSGPNGR